MEEKNEEKAFTSLPLVGKFLERHLLRQKARKEAEEKKRAYLTLLGRLWNRRQEVFQNKRVFYTPLPKEQTYFATLYACVIPPPFFLGELFVAAQESPKAYLGTCPDCGGETLVFSFSGSPLSGGYGSRRACTACARCFSTDSGKPFGPLWRSLARVNECFHARLAADPSRATFPAEWDPAFLEGELARDSFATGPSLFDDWSVSDCRKKL